MSKVLYEETRNGVKVSKDLTVGVFSTPEEFQQIIEKEKTEAPNAAAALDTWDGKEPLVYTFDTRMRTVGTWSVKQ
jgi:hypothetical protein